MNGDPVSRESLKNFYGYKETFGRDSVWVPVPQELTFITTNNPYDDEDGSINPSSVVDDNLIHNGMNFDTMPELHWKYGYPYALAVMVTLVTILFRLFKRSGWL